MDPYAPPKSAVDDVVPEAHRLRVRSSWLFGGATAALGAVGLFLAPQLLDGLNLATAAASVALTVLVSVWPLRSLAARGGDPAPLWWNALMYCIVGVMAGGAHFGESEVLAAGFLSLFGFGLVVIVSCSMLELRNRVRVYSTMNSFVITPRE